MNTIDAVSQNSSLQSLFDDNKNLKAPNKNGEKNVKKVKERRAIVVKKVFRYDSRDPLERVMRIGIKDRSSTVLKKDPSPAV